MSSVLLIGREQGICASIEGTLTAAGFYVHREGEGRRGLAVSQVVRFRTAILDLALTDIPGHQVVEDLRARDRQVRIFVHAAADLPSPAWPELVDARVLEYPLDGSKLIALLQEASAGRR
jgi:DNA-binding response OmpR family regulator